MGRQSNTCESGRTGEIERERERLQEWKYGGQRITCSHAGRKEVRIM